MGSRKKKQFILPHWICQMPMKIQVTSTIVHYSEKLHGKRNNNNDNRKKKEKKG